MNFKFFKKNQEETLFFNEHAGFGQLIALQPQRYESVEFCFQFNDNDPIVFANGPNDLHINISPTPNGNITFNDNGNVFKIFARERNRNNRA